MMFLAVFVNNKSVLLTFPDTPPQESKNLESLRRVCRLSQFIVLLAGGTEQTTVLAVIGGFLCRVEHLCDKGFLCGVVLVRTHRNGNGF
jgi:hypothetical protein